MANGKPPLAPKSGPILANTQANSGFRVACLPEGIGLRLGGLAGLLGLVGLRWVGLIRALPQLRVSEKKKEEHSRAGGQGFFVEDIPHVGEEYHHSPSHKTPNWRVVNTQPSWR